VRQRAVVGPAVAWASRPGCPAPRRANWLHSLHIYM